MTKNFTHLKSDGTISMVNVSDKPFQKRIAIAKGNILLQKYTITLIKNAKIKKGDVLNVARIAGIQAAKNTSQLIPLCHTLMLDSIDIELDFFENGICIKAVVSSFGRTGVEMEALTAVNIALLTIYDMCKAVDKEMKFTDIYLIHKEKK